MKSDDTIPLLLPVEDQGTAECAHFIHSDKTVGLFGDFPELTNAVRTGDLATISSLCAKLFDLYSASQRHPFSS